MLDRFSALNRIMALFDADGESVLSRYTTVQRYCFSFLFQWLSMEVFIIKVYKFQGLEWLYIAVDKRESLIQRYDRPNHFLTSSNVALHFNRKEINRPNLYNLWTQSKSWFDRLLKMGIPVRSGEILLSKTKFYFWPIFRLFLDVFPQLSPTQVGETFFSKKNPWVFPKIPWVF